MEFVEFPKMARLSREIVITEKIDGTNASITITEDGQFLTGSRTRWITPMDDNHQFAAWALMHKDELMKLGVGTHFGEWWGSGIQRGYGLPKGEKRFSLFNTHRWSDDAVRPACCHVVPVLYRGDFDMGHVKGRLDALEVGGSVAAPGFMNPEGIVIFHTAANFCFKKTIHKDEMPKAVADRMAQAAA
jgi:hypothetical protein